LLDRIGQCLPFETRRIGKHVGNGHFAQIIEMEGGVSGEHTARPGLGHALPRFARYAARDGLFDLLLDEGRPGRPAFGRDAFPLGRD